jgi:hypothetical protein
MFDSPFAFCEAREQCVLLDQCKRECAQEHECQITKCPLERYFVGTDYQALAEQERAAGQRCGVNCERNLE